MAVAVDPQSSIKFREYEEPFKGRCSSISILPDEKIVVSVTDCFFSLGLYYNTGIIHANGETISWNSNTIRYTSGKNPSIALIKHQDQTYAIEAHDTHLPRFRSSHYLVWRVDKEGRMMGENLHGRELASGLRPRVCANNDGWTAAVYENQDNYSVGQIDFSAPDLPIHWNSRQFNHRIGNNPDIAMHGTKVAIVFREQRFTLKSIVGELVEKDSTIDWKTEISVLPCSGLNPSIALNSRGVILCHQTTLFRKLVFIYGELNDRNIKWHKLSKTKGQTEGEFPSIAFTDQGIVFITYKTPFGLQLRLKTGNVTPLVTPLAIPTAEDVSLQQSLQQSLQEGSAKEMKEAYKFKEDFSSILFNVIKEDNHH